jgi:hypothetical protein
MNDEPQKNQLPMLLAFTEENRSDVPKTPWKAPNGSARREKP